MKKGQKFYLVIKRIIGIVGSIVGILLCIPLLWWWILPVNLVVTKGHPIYIQQRYGKHKKIFGLIKFRSMRYDAPEITPSDMTNELRDSLETKFGRFLRKTSLDETLQLINILFGQMAFIGPRPGSAHNEARLMELREMYNPSAFDVKPGMSGYAQVTMNRTHDPDDKAKFDHEYVKNISFFLDAKIFIITIFKMFGALKGN